MVADRDLELAQFDIKYCIFVWKVERVFMKVPEEFYLKDKKTNCL